MKKGYLISLVILLVAWETIAYLSANSIVFPSVEDTVVALLEILKSEDIYVAISFTLIRAAIGVSLSFLAAFILSSLAFVFPMIKEVIRPFISIFKTIPNVAIVIIALLLFKRSGAVLVAISLVALPLFYSDMIYAYEHIDEDIKKITDTYEDDLFIKFKRVFIPLIKPALVASLLKVSSLAFKVTVMAELLVQIKHGLGHELYFYRINILTPEVFALTSIMVLISLAIDFLIAKIKTYESE